MSSFICDSIHFSYPLFGNFAGTFIKKTSFKKKGSNLIIRCGPKNRLINCLFYTLGDNITIEIGKSAYYKMLNQG
jgi:hypothetical protein